MVLKRIFLILILPIFVYAQWTDPRPKSVQLWHMADGVIDSLTISAFYADTSEAKGTTLSENVGGLIRVNGFTSSSNYGAGLFLITNTSYTPDGANVINLNSGSNQLVRLNDPIIEDTTALKNLPPIWNSVYLKKLSSSNTNGGGMFVYADSAYPESGVFAFDADTQGKQWVRQDLIGKRPYYAIDYGVVPNDSTYSASNTDIINALCFEAYTGSNFSTKTGMVILPAGYIYIEKTPATNYCINIQAGIVVTGMGDSPQHNGTRLIVRAGESTSGDTLITVMNANAWDYYEDGAYVSNGWWHYSHLRDIYIDCNGNHQVGKISGLDIHRPGETSSVENVAIGSYKGWGMRVRSSSAPHLSISNLSINPASSADTTADYSYSDRKGLWVDAGGGVNISGLSGDNNRPLLYIGSAGNGASSSHVLINHMKYESGNSSSPGHSVSCPIVIDTVSYISSSIYITDLSATRGTDITAAQDMLIYIRGSNATTHQPTGMIHISQATGYDVLLKTEFGAAIDSIVNLSNNYSSVDAAQLSSVVRFGGEGRIDWSNYSPSKSYGTGFYYFNQNGFVTKSLYMSGSDFVIRSPYTDLVIEDSTGTDWLDFTATTITSPRIFKQTGQLNVESLFIIKETSTPSAVSGYGSIALIDDGSNQHLIIRFENGDVDTLASSTAP